MDHYAKLKDWPKIQTIRSTKAKLIDGLPGSTRRIAPYLGHTSSVDLNEVREQLPTSSRMLEAG
jgi:hypothetical protein